MSSWMPSFTSLPSILKRSRSDAESMSVRPPIQHNASLDLDSMPEMEGSSEILSMLDVRKISDWFPSRITGADWKLVFSTSLHGFSLASLYRKSQGERSPVLLVIEDTNGRIFGALLSEPIKIDEHFYGTGESFLFRLKPDTKLFGWSGENQLFVQGTYDSLIIGAGEGHFGLFIDNNLYQGRSQSCLTFNNEPLVEGEDFVIRTLECWSFA